MSSAIEVLREMYNNDEYQEFQGQNGYYSFGNITKALEEALLALEKQQMHKCDNPNCKPCEVCGGRHNCWHTNRTMKDDVKEMMDKERRLGFVQGQKKELEIIISAMESWINVLEDEGNNFENTKELFSDVKWACAKLSRGVASDLKNHKKEFEGRLREVEKK